MINTALELNSNTTIDEMTDQLTQLNNREEKLEEKRRKEEEEAEREEIINWLSPFAFIAK